MKKDTFVLIVLIIIVIVIISGINYIRGNNNINEPTMQCIADKSLLIVSRTCGHCANQLNILGKYKDLFEIIYIDENPEVIEQYNIKAVPTWIINQQRYRGVQSIETLKQLTRCDIKG